MPMFQHHCLKDTLMSEKAVGACSWADRLLDSFELLRLGVDNSGFWRRLWQLKIPSKWKIIGKVFVLLRVMGDMTMNCWASLETCTDVVRQIRWQSTAEEVIFKDRYCHIIALLKDVQSLEGMCGAFGRQSFTT